MRVLIKVMQETYSNYKELCTKILQLNPNIRFVGIINSNGRLVASSAKDKIKFHVGERDGEILFMEIALRTRMLEEFNFCLGQMNFSIYHREFLITMEFPLENETIFVSAEKEIDLDEMPFQIIEIIRKKNILYNIVN